MRRISKRPDICPICGDLTLYVISGSYVFKTPVNVKPEVIVIDDVEWEHCNNCGLQDPKWFHSELILRFSNTPLKGDLHSQSI